MERTKYEIHGIAHSNSSLFCIGKNTPENKRKLFSTPTLEASWLPFNSYNFENSLETEIEIVEDKYMIIGTKGVSILMIR